MIASSSWFDRTERGRGTLLVAMMLVAALAGCGDDGPGEPDASVSPLDGGVDAASLFDAGPPCESDEDCDDGVTCTRDFCDPAGFCRNPVDPAVCDDDIFCNGVEICDPRRGCIPGPRRTCSDDDVCTIDRCNEETKTCDRFPRDLDEDGDPDFFCAGGADCDDRDPLRHSRYPEICADGIDNDCDELVDEADCGRGPNDTCDDPLDVSSGGVFVIDTTGLAGDFSLGCTGSPTPGTVRRDAVLRFTLTEERDVRIAAEARAARTAVAIRSVCSERATEVECSYSFPAQVRARRMAPGTYFAIVSSDAAGEVAVTVELGDPTDPPPNETCASPLDVSGGGTFTGDTVDVSDDLTTSCSGLFGAPDLVYTFTTTAEQDVRIVASTASGQNLAWDLRTTCEADASSRRCAYGTPASGRVHQLPAGTYFLVVEGPSFAEVDFTLDVQILPPTPPAPGDLCGNASPLVLGAPTAGTLADKEDDYATSCGFNFPDAVHSFTLDARRDVTIEVDGGTASFNASLRGACEDESTQLRCARGTPVRTRLRDLGAGTYYVLVESFRAVPYTITVTDSAPVTPVAVSGNETCASAYVIPETGGVFTGDTTSMLDDLQTRTGCGEGARSADAVFRLVLPARRRVIASTGGSVFDTVLHLHGATCTSAGEIQCDDDGGDGSSSLIDRTLEAGTYHIVVDGRGMVSRGAYTLEVLVSP